MAASEQSNKSNIPSTTARGKQGEDIVCTWLDKNAYRVIERNFRIRGGEVDIIAEGNGELHFVEVKRWNRELVHDLARNLDHRRLARMREVARRWLFEHRPGFPKVQFDLALVDPATGAVEFFEGALNYT